MIHPQKKDCQQSFHSQTLEQSVPRRVEIEFDRALHRRKGDRKCLNPTHAHSFDRCVSLGSITSRCFGK